MNEKVYNGVHVMTQSSRLTCNKANKFKVLFIIKFELDIPWDAHGLKEST